MNPKNQKLKKKKKRIENQKQKAMSTGKALKW